MGPPIGSTEFGQGAARGLRRLGMGVGDRTEETRRMTKTTTVLLAVPLLGAASAFAGDLFLQPKAGEPLRGLTAAELALFEEGKVLYSTPIATSDGMGPIFNKSNCQSCHSTPTGGWGNASVMHFGMSDKGAFSVIPGEPQSLLQEFAVSEFCKEHVPAAANFTAIRMTNSSMAFGMVEAVPDAAIAALEDPDDLDGDGVSGRIHWVRPLEEVDRAAPLRAGRFGWKAQVATVLSFSADATRNEMGITNRLLTEENAPNGDVSRLSQCDPVPEPEDIADSSGFAFIDRVTHFQRYLSVPPQTPKSGMAGESLFISVGCAKCHVPEWTTSNSPALEDAIRGKVIRPYSDFMLHDMGLQGDGVSDGYAGETELRTPTLWNLRTRDPMMHNGAASGGTFGDRVRTAIALHGPYGESASSAAAFAKLTEGQKDRLVAFLDSLGRVEFDASGDGHVDELDLASFAAAYATPVVTPDSPGAVHDIDQDGDVDETDLDWLVQAYESPESGNADCNGNGVADVRDIARGTSADADADGVPDDCASCTGDLDSNGSVNGQDLGMLLAAWAAAGGPADLNRDGTVNGQDLGVMLAAWGACP
jgi:CxxC motif-containing protein (DUF1111 family)